MLRNDDIKHHHVALTCCFQINHCELLMQNEPKIIDHNPDERRPTNGVWWVAWIIVVIGWVWYLNYCEFDRDAIALGALTGIVLTLWSLEMKGDNEPPSWLKGKPRVRR